jgi:hypothetical protein
MFEIIPRVNEQQDFLKRIEYHNGDRCRVQSPARDSRREIFAITGIQLRELREIQRNIEVLQYIRIGHRTIDLSFPADISTSLLYTKDN